MTTENDSLEDRIGRFGPGQETEGTISTRGGDVTGQFPSYEYAGVATTNILSYGAKVTGLEYAVGNGTFDTSTVGALSTSVRVTETASGHIVELNDTPGNERVLIRHNSGAGVEIANDGTVNISSHGNQVLAVKRDQTIVIEGDANMIYNGNVKMSVAGDYFMDVRGNYSLNVNGKKGEAVKGSSETSVEGNAKYTYKSNLFTTTLSRATHTVLGSFSNFVKGVSQYASQGDTKIQSGSNTQISGSTGMLMTGDKTVVSGNTMTVFGGSGSIGGPGMTMQAKGATFDEGVEAPTFHGNLYGTAQGVGIVTPTAVPSITTLPNTSKTAEYVETAAPDVKIDIGEHLFNLINRSVATDGISVGGLTTSQARSKLRDAGNFANETLIGNLVAEGVISPTYSNPTPPAIGRVSPNTPTPQRGRTPISNSGPGLASGRFQPPERSVYKFIPGTSILNDSTVGPNTELADGVKLARFLGVDGDPVTMDHITDTTVRARTARNLQQNAELYKSIRDNTGEFSNTTIRVIEGLYKPGPSESVTPADLNDFAQQGRSAVYELFDKSGNPLLGKSFDLAVHIKNVFRFQKLILDYDTFDPSGDLNAQIIVIFPSLDSKYDIIDGDYKNAVETRFNNNVISSTDIVEIDSEGNIVQQEDGTGSPLEASNVNNRINSLPVSESVKAAVRADLATMPGFTAVYHKGKVYYVAQDYYYGYLENADGAFGAWSLDDARRIAAQNGAILPDASLVTTIHRTADIAIPARPITPAGTSNVSSYNSTTRSRLESAGAAAGLLVSGYKKDFTSGGGFIGLWKEDGTPYQGGLDRATDFLSVHGSTYVDYSHGVRLVKPNGRDGTTGEIVSFR